MASSTTSSGRSSTTPTPPMMLPTQNWIPLALRDSLTKTVANKNLREPQEFGLQTFDQLRPPNLNQFTADELYSVLLMVQEDRIIQIEGFPERRNCTREELVGEICGFFTAWSPYCADYTARPELQCYSLQISRYFRQRVIHLHQGKSTIIIPWPTQVDRFNLRQIEQIVSRWKERGLVGEDRNNSSSPTNCVVFYAAQQRKPTGMNLQFPTNIITRYPFPPDIGPARFAVYMSGLRRVRLSARINEKFITPIGCSFFVQETQDSIPLHRARFNEEDLNGVKELLRREENLSLDNLQIRVRLFGLRPQQIYRTGLGPEVLEGPTTQPETGQFTILSNLPEGELMKEIRDQWMVLPLVMPVTHVHINPGANVAFWIFPSIAFNKSHGDIARQHADCDPFVMEKDHPYITVVPKEVALEPWRHKVNWTTLRKLTPLVDSVCLPSFITQQFLKDPSLALECAYRDHSRSNPERIALDLSRNPQIQQVRGYKEHPPHPFRGVLLVELIRKLSQAEMREKVLEKPPLDVPKVAAAPPACPICKRTQSLLRCAQCKEVSYCGLDHQRQDWSKHKDLCKQRYLELKKEESRNASLDDDIAESSSVTVSLECPLTGARCITPVRSINCKHPRCFDLQAWIDFHLLPEPKANHCPLCNIAVHLDDLRLSERLRIACEKLDEEVAEVCLGENDLYEAKWRDHQKHKVKAINPAATDVTYDEIDSDDDGSDGDGSDGFIPEHLKRPRPNSGQAPADPAGQELVQLSSPPNSSTAPTAATTTNITATTTTSTPTPTNTNNTNTNNNNKLSTAPNPLTRPRPRPPNNPQRPANHPPTQPPPPQPPQDNDFIELD